MANNDYRCVLCQSADLHRSARQPEDFEYNVVPNRPLEVFVCGACGSGMLYPRPTVSELVSYYPADYHAYNEDHGAIAKRLVEARSKKRAAKMVRLAGRSPVRLFDVGSGDCRHFKDMSKYGEFEFAGVEINPGMVRAARGNGYNVFEGTLEEMDITELEGTFDVVTMYQLVEHVLDPQFLLKKVFALLRPGGYAMGQLPCMGSVESRLFGRYWAGYHYPRHLQMITKNGLRTALETAGFRDVSVNTALHLQAGLSLQNFLVGSLGYRPKMTFGKTPAYSLLLLAAAPYCIFEYVAKRGGMMDFMARKWEVIGGG
jgi:SAM-dependent methyltransferase